MRGFMLMLAVAVRVAGDAALLDVVRALGCIRAAVLTNIALDAGLLGPATAGG